MYSAGAVGELAGTKVNLSAEEVAEVPIGLITVMSTVVTVSAPFGGAVTMSVVVADAVPARVKPAGDPPKLTWVTSVKPVPVMVTLYPPAVEPETGDTPVTVGVLIVGMVTVAVVASEDVLSIKFPMTGGLVTLVMVIVTVLPGDTSEEMDSVIIAKPPDSSMDPLGPMPLFPVSSLRVAWAAEKLVLAGAIMVMELTCPRAPEELVLKSMV